MGQEGVSVVTLRNEDTQAGYKHAEPPSVKSQNGKTRAVCGGGWTGALIAVSRPLWLLGRAVAAQSIPGRRQIRRANILPSKVEVRAFVLFRVFRDRSPRSVALGKLSIVRRAKRIRPRPSEASVA